MSTPAPRMVLWSSALLSPVVLLVPVANASLHYAITEIQPPAGRSYTEVESINAHGDIAGYTVDWKVASSAFIYSNGQYRTVSAGGPGVFSLSGLNDAHAGIGYRVLDSGAVSTTAVRWADGKIEDLEAPSKTYSALSATSLNDEGVAVGGAQDQSSPAGRAAVWHGTTGSLLPTLGGDSDMALAINDKEMIVGESTDHDGTHAVLWKDGQVKDLGGFGGSSSAATDINNAGDIVGVSDDLAGKHHGFVWQDGAMHDLGSANEIYAINNDGAIVGMKDNAATLWNDGEVTDLNSLLPADSGWNLKLARDVNDSGQIVGMGIHNGEYRGFLLTPEAVGSPHAIPLPSPALLGMTTMPLAWLGARILRRTEK